MLLCCSHAQGARSITVVYQNYLLQTQRELWLPKKLGKPKWEQTQLELVLLCANFAQTVCTVKHKVVPSFWDSAVDGSLCTWDLNDRFEVFKWLLGYAKWCAEPARVAGVNHEHLEDTRRKYQLMIGACTRALTHLAAVGRMIPDDHLDTLVKGDILSYFIELDKSGYVLFLLLCSVLFLCLFCHHGVASHLWSVVVFLLCAARC